MLMLGAASAPRLQESWPWIPVYSIQHPPHGRKRFVSQGSAKFTAATAVWKWAWRKFTSPAYFSASFCPEEPPCHCLASGILWCNPNTLPLNADHQQNGASAECCTHRQENLRENPFLSKLLKGHLIALFQFRLIKYSPFYPSFLGIYNFAIKIHSTLKLGIHRFTPQDMFKDTRAEIFLFWQWLKWILTFNPAAQHIGKLKKLLKITAIKKKKKAFAAIQLGLSTEILVCWTSSGTFWGLLSSFRGSCWDADPSAVSFVQELEPGAPPQQDHVPWRKGFTDRADTQTHHVLKTVSTGNFREWPSALRGGKSCITWMPGNFNSLAMGTVALRLCALGNYREKNLSV